MQFFITAYDGKDRLEKRMSIRQRHLENVARVREKGSVLCAGGILDNEGRIIGSMLVMDFADRKLLDEYLETEPYLVEGVWEDVRVENMNVVFMNDEKVGK